MQKVYVYDPTASDSQSAVRGVGRYLQILRENFSNEFVFVSEIKNLKFLLTQARKIKNSIFINPFFNFLKPPLTMKRISNKQIAVIHDLIPLKYPSHFPAGIKGTIYILLNKLALKNYDLIITDSEASKKDIIEKLKVKSQKVKVVYPCLPKSFSNLKIKNLDLNENCKLKIENFCLYVGDATWNKNLVNLAKAIKLTDVRCVFVGNVFKSFSGKAQIPILSNRLGPLWGEAAKNTVSSFSHSWQEELKEFYELTKDDKRFIFKGFVTDSELLKLYEQAVVNILPSRDEGFGFSYLEASAAGCPSILSDIPVLREISGNNALFVNPENPEDIASQIKKIYSDKNLRQQLIAGSKKRRLFFSDKKFKKDFAVDNLFFLL